MLHARELTFWVAVLGSTYALAPPVFAEGSGDTTTMQSPRPWWVQALDNDYYKISVNVRGRMELAERDDLESSQAYTFRTRAGIGNKPLFGFSGYAELENTFSVGNAFFDVVSEPNGRTPIADPDNTELNRLWLQFANEDWAGIKVKAGRQRIVLDDSRFVGNVIWRQNEQTYDSALLQTNAGIDDLTVMYAYIVNVNRIFGDQGPDGTRDFDANTHVVHTRYSHPVGIDVTAFAYLLDFDNSPANSSNTWGGRVTGGHEVGIAKLGYVFSYAHQTDAGDNPVDYQANYVNAEASVGFWVGTITFGYELLGSDDGVTQFVTPLSTAHKFNGFADVFLNNGGPNGLQDFYATVSPTLPFGLKGFATYHHFWSDEGGDSLGDEFDFVLKRAFGDHFGILTKGAFFFGETADLPDTWRFNLDLTLAF